MPAGIVGFNGAPRPALVTAGGVLSARAHEMATTANNVIYTARPIVEMGVCDMGADHTFVERMNPCARL
jgi:hypothetical protein